MPNDLEESLDPDNWTGLRQTGHRMLDDMFDYLQDIRSRPVWQTIPTHVREAWNEPLPLAPTSLEATHDLFMQSILPYSIGNTHPGFLGWVHGGGTAVGMLAEMLAAGLNANLGGRDHIPIEVERQVVGWVREMFGFPESATGLFVTGTSIANLMGVVVARNAALGAAVRSSGVTAEGPQLVAYTSAAAHGCIAQAMDLTGLGTQALRLVPVNDQFQMNPELLEAAIAADRLAGRTPFLVIGTAGTVDVGAIDQLDRLADIASRERLWLHVDGAYAALGVLAPDIAPRLAGLERADSIAFDFHKWGQVPYDAGFFIVRDGAQHREAFAAPAAYLRRETRGMAVGSNWPCDLGPDLSRGFRALKTWFTLKVYGAEKMGRIISQTCRLARYLQACIEATPQLKLLAPAFLNIVCFGYRCEDADAVNAAIAVDLQESGRVAPSTTIVKGAVAIRAAVVNHRTTASDIDALVRETLRFGEARSPHFRKHYAA